MEQSSKFLTGVVIGAGVACLVAVTPIAGDAQTMDSTPPASQQVAQVPFQPTASGTVLARLSLRITQLENEIRRLTGQNEELTYRVDELTEMLNKATSDTALRLKALEEGVRTAGAPGTAAASPPATSDIPAPATRMASNAPVAGADKGAKVLGTLRTSPGASATEVAGVVRPPAMTKSETPEDLYDRAHSLIVKHRKYGEAERVLRQFIDGNPKHPLAANAHYWLGRTFFVRGDFENAAFAFAEGFQKYPEAEKAPANLLNLGMSLARLGKNREACTTYTRLLRTYKDADSSIKRRITRERQRANCRSR